MVKRGCWNAAFNSYKTWRSRWSPAAVKCRQRPMFIMRQEPCPSISLYARVSVLGLGLMFALIFVMRFPKTLISRRAQPFILPAFVTPSPCEPSTPSLTASHPMLPTRSQDCFVRHSRFCLNYDQASRSGKLFRTSIWIAIWCLRTPKPSRLRLASH